MTSSELTNDLLELVRRKFYEGQGVAFNKDKKRLLQWVILWPASHLRAHGVTLPPERYKAIFVEVILMALRQGNTGAIKYLPAWLAKVVQSHFKIHWDELYSEAKSARKLTEHTLIIAGRLPVDKKPDIVAQMALASDLLKGTGRTKKSAVEAPLNDQINLF